MRKKFKFTSAFTMLELIFVIIILGIVSSIGAELIAKVYGSYIVQRAQHRATVKTELAVLQIANRLTSAIPGTLYRIKDDNSTETVEVNMGGSPDGYKGLLWVGSDTDSFTASPTPGWTGFCDLTASTKTTMSTPGSSLGLTAEVIMSLSNTPVVADLVDKTAVYFPHDSTHYIVSHVDPVTPQIFLKAPGASHMVEHYKLAWTSYALVVENNTDGGQDLNLYYNFMPTPANAYGNGTKTLLLHNVSTFRFKVAGRTMRFKVCKQERISDDVNITSCKEKAVF